MIRVLIIDDDYSLFKLLAEYLGTAGFTCHHAPDGEAGLAAIARESWDMVILDIMLPGKNGHEVLRSIRFNSASRALPVLMLTARGEEDDKVQGLELGADDYLSKPFGPKELIARLRALLRRSRFNTAPTGGDSFQLDDLKIEKSAQTLVRDGERIELTASELRLMELFAESVGKVVGRETLYREILGHPPFAQDRSLDMMMSRLRKKLGPRRDGKERIRAARGQGYVFLLTGDE